MIKITDNPIAEDELQFECDMKLFEEAKKHNWESLLYASGTEIAYLKKGKYMVLLDVSGETKIIDNKDNSIYEGAKILKNKELMKEIKKDIYSCDRYEVVDNNWFCLTFFEYRRVETFIPFTLSEEEIAKIENESEKEEKYLSFEDVVFDGAECVSDILADMKSMMDYCI